MRVSATHRHFMRQGIARLMMAAAGTLGIVRGDACAELPAGVVPVLAPGATCAAVHDQLGILAIGQKGAAEHHLAIYRLDASGNLQAGDAAKVRLPKSDSLASLANYPLSIVFHPSLPLLYVWQDIAAPKAGSPEEKVVYDEFDHLLIVGVKDGALQPVGRAARGPQFASGQSIGTIAIDPAGERLFMPNLQDTAAGTDGRAALGYFDLDEQGLPRPVPVPLEGSLDGYGLEKFELQMRPAMLRIGAYQVQPAGWGFFTTSKEAVAFGWQKGIAVWDTENRRGEHAAVNMYAMPQCWIGGDPRLPVVFGVGYQNASVFSIQQVDGYPTLLPQITTVAGARFVSAPLVMMGKKPRLAIGGVNNVHVLALDAGGRFTGGAEAIEVANPVVQAIAYSEKHDRLYVAVEKAP